MNQLVVSQDTGNFYGDYLHYLSSAVEYVLAQTQKISEKCLQKNGRDPIENVKFRIKTPESMTEKLKNHGYDVTTQNAVSKVYDAAGVRIVTSFLEDVEVVAEYIRQIPGLRVVAEKDYINRPKRNGYRSYHIICEVLSDISKSAEHIFVEIQIRTIAMDTWASVEHRMKYKKMVVDEKLIVDELKRCADELAAVDLSLQMLSKIISGGIANEDFVCRGRESNVRCRYGGSAS